MLNTLSRRQVMAGLAVLPFMRAPVLAATLRVERIMVQGRPQDTGSLYKVRNIVPALDQLGGVRRMRCREPYSGTPGWNTYVGLAREGVRFCFTLSVRAIATTLADLKAFLVAAPGSIWAIEFPNEPDLNPVTYKGQSDPRLGFRTGDAPALMAFIADFTAALRADPALAAIPLIASNDYMQAEQGAFADFGNAHVYPRAATAVGDRLTRFGEQVAAGGHAQGVLTEWGRTTGGDAKNATAPPVTLDQQATLLASDVAAALERPFVHTISLYELFAWGGTSEMNNFGLFNADLTPRPAVATIRAVIG
ncbi:calcium-binding protein [Novosphingobium resinovorum]|uniref:calcium-binding protein n=1 Tax=Novosphingobium resinovorum TaxID=158500 RepID=UPI002ED2410A|nr:calcium-binding protein [Novosphingobium resinovorum]